MSIETIISDILKKLENLPPLGARYKFEFGDDDIVLVDATVAPPAISQEDGEADTVFICTPEVFAAILSGTQDPTMAYMTGKLKIKGSMGYAMKLSSLLGD